MDKEDKTYEARGICTNCGYKNYPQWGIYKIRTKLSDYPCYKCGCRTWILDLYSSIKDIYVGKTKESNQNEN